MEITFVEGLPCAGKSLLVKYLERKGFSVIHELGRLIKSEEFPGNGNSLEEVLAIDNWFIEKENSRMNNSKGFFDRSYLTHLTYAFAYSNYKQLNSFEKTVKKYYNEILSSRLKLPDNVIYIDISPEESIKRQNYKILIGRRPLDNFWRSITFLIDLRFAYDALFNCFSGINLIRVDGMLSTHEKYELIMQNIQTTSSKSKHIDLRKYIRDLS